MSADAFDYRCAGRAFVAMLVLGLLAACGGDGAVGSGGTGAAVGEVQGTVNGFGSVIVDGHAFDDRSAAVVEEVAPGQDAPAEVKLGDRVSVEYSAAGVADLIRREAALAGPVSAVTAGGMTVLGQTVRVNGNVAAGPLTVFAGAYTSQADVRAGDSVEIHAIVVPAATGYSLQATRVERIAPPQWLRVTGLVSALSTNPTGFRLGSLAVDAGTATVLPSGTGLDNGDAVDVMAPAASLTATASTLTVTAARIRKDGLRNAGLDDYVSGRVTGLDTVAKTFVLGAQRVRYASASVAPTVAALADGVYAQVRGSAATDGILDAAAVTVRADDSAAKIELTGNVSAFDPVAARFIVRGVEVDARAAALRGCPAAGLSDGLYVHVTGTSAGVGVVASSVECEDESTGSTIEREGRASNVDVAAMTFLLTTGRGSVLPVRWTTATYFGSITPQTLAGQPVEVEGSLSGTTLVATKVKLEN